MRPHTMWFVLAAVWFCCCTHAQSDDEGQDDQVDMVVEGEGEPKQQLYGERVERIFARNISDFRIVDRQRVILYVTRNKPYLIVLKRPANALQFSPVIGLKRRSSSIDARFDSIYVDGFAYAIDYMEKLTPETAKRLLGEQPADDSEDGHQ